ncbi:hypothetical protein CROQUDRAFT_88580 [Cronartium quercuum f. sp. fusiforme G11]|uniref:VTT domain-containing protein n=1 Tax=Cronartium quercuum f. sp. fusiforme G11 TaxID=708437 RepID=A0A9P6TFJ9_9BASI|nr:hypothetical protein CROQUDRAFT_88580 [Cronartium quercuum f. sp. fusiforme G11]
MSPLTPFKFQIPTPEQDSSIHLLNLTRSNWCDDNLSSIDSELDSPSTTDSSSSSSSSSSIDSTPPPTPISTLPPLPINSTHIKSLPYSSSFSTHQLNPNLILSHSSHLLLPPSWSSSKSQLPNRLSDSNQSRSTFQSIPSSDALIPRLVLLLALLLTSFLIIALLLSTIPGLHLPTSLPLVREQISHLRTYAASSTIHFIHLTFVLSLIFIWKQAFSIPGTVLLNILLGALYGTWISTALTCLLTALGSTAAYAMAKIARPVVERFLPKPLRAVESAVDRFRIEDGFDTTELSTYLLVARLLPVVPYAALNLASGILGLPLIPFFWTLVIGSLPYNFVTTQLGDILSIATDQTHTTIWSSTLLAKLALVSIGGALPVLLKGRIRPWLAKARRSTTVTARRRMISLKVIDLGSSSRKVASVLP